MTELWLWLSHALALDQLHNFHFLRPWWLLFIVPAALIYWLLNEETDQLSQWKPLMSEKMLGHLAIEGNTRRWLSPRKLFLPFLLLTTLVLAGPSWKQQPSPFLTDQSVLVIALDLSSSMNDKDLPPSRLLRAKQKINELLKMRGDAKTALIAFAGTAHVAMPVSRDREMIRHFLDVLDSSVMPRKSKNPTSVLPKLQTLLGSKATPTTVLLMTDTVDNAAVKAYREYFETSGYQLVVWSINNPDYSANDSAVRQLSDLAGQSGGELVHFDLEGGDISVINRHIRSHLVAAPDSALPWQDAGYYLLYLLAALQLLWFRKGWTLKW